MPKLIGAPFSLTNIQQEREVTRITFDISYPTPGVPAITATANGVNRFRDAAGASVVPDQSWQTIGTYADAQITGAVRVGILAALSFLDTQ
jgi:hypothetical protein